MGGEFGFQMADRIVNLLRALQVGNAGLAQVRARHELHVDICDDEE